MFCFTDTNKQTNIHTVAPSIKNAPTPTSTQDVLTDLMGKVDPEEFAAALASLERCGQPGARVEEICAFARASGFADLFARAKRELREEGR